MKDRNTAHELPAHQASNVVYSMLPVPLSQIVEASFENENANALLKVLCSI